MGVNRMDTQTNRRTDDDNRARTCRCGPDLLMLDDGGVKPEHAALAIERGKALAAEPYAYEGPWRDYLASAIARLDPGEPLPRWIAGELIVLWVAGAVRQSDGPSPTPVPTVGPSRRASRSPGTESERLFAKGGLDDSDDAWETLALRVTELLRADDAR